MKNKKNKNFQNISSDKEAEDFVANADLSEYNFKSFQPAQFEFLKKTETINLRLPKRLLMKIKEIAQEKDMPYSRLIREMIESNIARESS